MKREDSLTWDQYFMGIARLSAMRSKDPHTCVGACIVGEDNKILSMGYNGMPRGCSDEMFPWEREGEDELQKKYVYVCHAELNAILNYDGPNMRGARIYTTLFPCNECTKALIQVGIREVIYIDNLYPDSVSVIAAKKMMKSAGISYRRYEPSGLTLSVEL